MNTVNYKYDVVISFAEEQRDIALAITNALDKANISSYYYPNQLNDSVGKDMNLNLPNIYEHQARCAIVIISPAYLTKRWTKVEWEAILRRSKKDSNYLIPILAVGIDYNNIEGLTKDVVHLKWRSETDSIMQLLKEKLGVKEPKTSNKKSEGSIINNGPINVDGTFIQGATGNTFNINN